MERCGACGSAELDTIEYLEDNLLGYDTVRVVILWCTECGWSERSTSHAVPVPG
jgi:hypothetical protein